MEYLEDGIDDQRPGAIERAHFDADTAVGKQGVLRVDGLAAVLALLVGHGTALPQRALPCLDDEIARRIKCGGLGAGERQPNDCGITAGRDDEVVFEFLMSAVELEIDLGIHLAVTDTLEVRHAQSAPCTLARLYVVGKGRARRFPVARRILARAEELQTDLGCGASRCCSGRFGTDEHCRLRRSKRREVARPPRDECRPGIVARRFKREGPCRRSGRRSPNVRVERPRSRPETGWRWSRPDLGSVHHRSRQSDNTREAQGPGPHLRLSHVNSRPVAGSSACKVCAFRTCTVEFGATER